MNFASDNTSGAHPKVLQALAAVDPGPAMPYGADPVSARAAQRLAEVFEHDSLLAYPLATGTAANALTLACLTEPWGAVYCHRESHINTDECGAPELYTAGAKLIPLDGAHGKLTPATLRAALAQAHPGFVHAVQPQVLALTQPTEAGTVYTPAEVAALAEVAHAHGLAVQMDGARFANALVALGCTPAETTWKAGVDVLAFGATKNGALAGEAAIFFDPGLARGFAYRRKRGGHLLSKMRYVAAQLEAYLGDDVWLVNAGHANAMARRLGHGLAELPGCRLLHPVEANEVFVAVPTALADGLAAEGFAFYRWGPPAGPGDPIAAEAADTAGTAGAADGAADSTADSTTADSTADGAADSTADGAGDGAADGAGTAHAPAAGSARAPGVGLRLVASWNSAPEHVEALLHAAARLAPGAV